jgi:hypothetical protein
MTFGTMKVVGGCPYAPAVFTPRSILTRLVINPEEGTNISPETLISYQE